MFEYKVTKFNWVTDDPKIDLCLHGSVYAKIGNHVICDHSHGDGWCVSAGVLYLLRTLERDHIHGNRVGEFLIPCCGDLMIADQSSNDVEIFSGCPNGINWSVEHIGDSVKITDENLYSTLVSFHDYKTEVLNAAEAVKMFYSKSQEKVTDKGSVDELGYTRFWEEWNRRVEL